jgi:hypothetical protein
MKVSPQQKAKHTERVAKWKAKEAERERPRVEAFNTLPQEDQEIVRAVIKFVHEEMGLALDRTRFTEPSVFERLGIVDLDERRAIHVLVNFGIWQVPPFQNCIGLWDLLALWISTIKEDEYTRDFAGGKRCLERLFSAMERLSKSVPGFRFVCPYDISKYPDGLDLVTFSFSVDDVDEDVEGTACQ